MFSEYNLEVNVYTWLETTANLYGKNILNYRIVNLSSALTQFVTGKLTGNNSYHELFYDSDRHGKYKSNSFLCFLHIGGHCLHDFTVHLVLQDSTTFNFILLIVLLVVYRLLSYILLLARSQKSFKITPADYDESTTEVTVMGASSSQRPQSASSVSKISFQNSAYDDITEENETEIEESGNGNGVHLRHVNADVKEDDEDEFVVTKF